MGTGTARLRERRPQSRNGREGAGRRVRPPGTEHPPRAILAVHEGDHLNHLVRR